VKPEFTPEAFTAAIGLLERDLFDRQYPFLRYATFEGLAHVIDFAELNHWNYEPSAFVLRYRQRASEIQKRAFAVHFARWACTRNHPALLRSVEESHSLRLPPNSHLDADRSTALMLAVRCGSIDVVRMLLARKETRGC
jgi:hypothetical protein